MDPIVKDTIVRHARAAGETGRQMCREHLRLLGASRSPDVRDRVKRLSAALHALTMSTPDQIFVISELVGRGDYAMRIKSVGVQIAHLVEEIDHIAMTPQEAADDPRR